MVTNSPIATAAPDLGMLLAQASHALNIEMTGQLQELGITPRGFCVLSKALPGELSQGQIAEQADLDKTTMVVTIDQLESAGLAERRPSSTDRRARIIAVTPAGAQIVARGQAIVDRVYDTVLADLPARNRAAFVESLERLVQGCGAGSISCASAPRRRAARAS
jgi:MarR family transcriptional regulator, transcriptional regulator for hemolysin